MRRMTRSTTTKTTKNPGGIRRSVDRRRGGEGATTTLSETKKWKQQQWRKGRRLMICLCNSHRHHQWLHLILFKITRVIKKMTDKR